MNNIKEKLILGKEMAFLSKKLASIKTDVDFDFNLEKCQFGKFEKKEITEMLEDFGFKSLIILIYIFYILLEFRDVFYS